MNNPTMFIFAGNNGSGKSTIRNLIAEKIGIEINIDPDSIARKHKNNEVIAGKEAIEFINECIENRRTFSMETTMSGKLTFNQIKKAKLNGFEIVLFFIGLSNIELNISRVANRVKNGGHHIPTEDIIRREQRTLKNVKENLIQFDQIILMDNTSKNAEIMLVYRNGKIIYQGKIAAWANPVYKEVLKYNN